MSFPICARANMLRFIPRVTSRFCSQGYTRSISLCPRPIPYASLMSRTMVTLNQTSYKPANVGPTKVADVSISDKAVKQLKTIIEREKDPEQILRVLVDSGGCHGYQNKFELTTSTDEDDTIFEKDGVRVVVDNISLKFIRGSQIDFVEELIGATFQVVDNPNAKNSCGCNISYDIDLDMLTQN